MSTWPIPSKTLVIFLGWQHLHTCCHKPLLEELSMSCVTPLGKRALSSLCLVSSRPHPWAFPLVDFAGCPFAVINQSSEHNYILSPASPTPTDSRGGPGDTDMPRNVQLLQHHLSEGLLLLEFSCHLCQNQFTINVKIYFWILFCSIACPYASTTLSWLLRLYSKFKIR